MTATRLSPMTPETLRLRQSTRTTDYIELASGVAFWPLEPEPQDIRIEDIAHGLARICRFAGHVRADHYSVAQHSVMVSKIVPVEDALWGLLHDAGEGIGCFDCPRPMKRSGQFGIEYRKMEQKVMEAVCIRFGLSLQEPPAVKQADNVMLMTEQRDLMGPPIIPWQENGIELLADRIIPWPAQLAEIRFLDRFHELFPDFAG